jgi:F0F1-type ATP synthase assembly protein I
MSKKTKLNFFDKAIEAIGWLQIIASPFIGGIIVGGIIYLLIRNTLGVVIAILFACTGLITGIVLANRISRKSGTIDFMSRVDASPELDNTEADAIDK